MSTIQTFDSIVEFLKTTQKEDLINKPTQFKEAVELIRKQLHEKLDQAKDRLIDYGIRAFEKEDKKFVDEWKTKQTDVNKTISVKQKVHELVADLDGMLKRTEFLDESIRAIKEDSTANLLIERKGVLDFKLTRKFVLKVDGKSFADLVWTPQIHNSQSSSIDSSDKQALKVHANCCYNYYLTDKLFTEENVEVTFLTNCYQSSNYFYVGVRNELNNPSSECMCCSINTCTYLTIGAGRVRHSNTAVTESGLTYNNSSRGEFKITVRLMASEKTVYFDVNEQGEKGPYALTGSKFQIVFGSCNECNGYIKIDSAQYI